MTLLTVVETSHCVCVRPRASSSSRLSCSESFEAGSLFSCLVRFEFICSLAHADVNKPKTIAFHTGPNRHGC